MINTEKLIIIEELVKLRGGYDEQSWDFRCKCAFTGGYLSECFSAPGPYVTNALQWAGAICGGLGATCNYAVCPG